MAGCSWRRASWPADVKKHGELQILLVSKKRSKKWVFRSRTPLDVFSDGSATLLSTPGHTPGHQSLLVRLANRPLAAATRTARSGGKSPLVQYFGSGSVEP